MTLRRHPIPSRRARGVTLIIALIMMAALGLLAAWAMKSSTTNLRIVGNGQARLESFAAAQAAIEQTISSPLFTQQPAALAALPINIDIDGDGVPDQIARLSPAPACYRLRVVKMSELDAATAADLPCLRSSSAQNAGIDTGSASGGADSLCADSEWNVRAEVSDTATGAKVAVNQGVAVRGLVTDAINSCP